MARHLPGHFASPYKLRSARRIFLRSMQPDVGLDTGTKLQVQIDEVLQVAVRLVDVTLRVSEFFAMI
jgi:hypothetical protein